MQTLDQIWHFPFLNLRFFKRHKLAEFLLMLQRQKASHTVVSDYITTIRRLFNLSLDCLQAFLNYKFTNNKSFFNRQILLTFYVFVYPCWLTAYINSKLNSKVVFIVLTSLPTTKALIYTILTNFHSENFLYVDRRGG